MNMSKIFRVLVSISLAGGIASVTNAAIYSAGASTISKIDSYTQYGGGDVIVTLASNTMAAACPYGFWIRGSDAGAKTAVAQVLAAHHTGSSVVIYADTAITWSGSQSPACLVWTVQTL
jgi:hypothetical protein